MTLAVAIMTTFAASAQFMVVTTVNTPDSDLNEEWGTTNFTDNLGIGYIYNDKCVNVPDTYVISKVCCTPFLV